MARSTLTTRTTTLRVEKRMASLSTRSQRANADSLGGKIRAGTMPNRVPTSHP